ncbi:MAG TPA: hypothetical protein VGK73_30460, partial [Polyangiaceae bacterium]
RRTAVLFSDGSDKGRVALAGPADVVVVAGLEPGRRYKASFDARGCIFTLSAARDGTFSASAGGALRASATEPCKE